MNAAVATWSRWRIDALQLGKITDRKAEAPPPGPEDFTPQAVYRAVLLDTVQHPLTILPAAVAAVGALAIALLGLSPGTFAATFGGGILALAAWVYNYFVRGEALAVEHVARLYERRHQLRRDEVGALVDEWRETGHAEGHQQARELREAHRRLEELLSKRLEERGGRDLHLQRLLVLAEDTCREGVEVLGRALEIHRALAQIDRDKLGRELTQWRLELDGAGDDDVKRRSLTTRIAAHERRLALCGEQERTLIELLAQSEELEAALESTYLGAVDLASTDGLFTKGHAAAELERAVHAARRVDERLRGMTDEEEDEVYVQAGNRRN